MTRTVTVLKAALNRALRGTDMSDRAWRLLKPLAGADAARPGHLSVAEAQRLVNAADAASGFRDLVQAALLTGCRYGECVGCVCPTLAEAASLCASPRVESRAMSG